MSTLHLPTYAITHPLVEDIYNGVTSVLGKDRLIGFYLGGSLAIGGFSEATSDLDFVVVVDSPIDDQAVNSLRKVHDQIRSSNKNRLYGNHEGIYITADQARTPKTEGLELPHLGSDGHFAVEPHGPELIIDLWTITESGFAVYGPQPSELIGEVTTEDMLQAIVDIFQNWWLPKLLNHEVMDDEYQVYAVLTMARISYGLIMRGEVSKKEAAAWFAQNNQQYADLLRRALAWNASDHFDEQEKVYELIGLVAAQIASMPSSSS